MKKLKKIIFLFFFFLFKTPMKEPKEELNLFFYERKVIFTYLSK
jgi:hypothetical protein